MAPALLLTAGLGTRLGPLTARRAKPSLTVAGVPLVERIIRWLVGQRVTDLLLNLHYRPDTLTAIVGDGRHLGASVRYSWEDPILGSGGGPRRAFALVESPRLWLVNGDTLTTLDLGPMAAAHEASGALVTLAVKANPDPTRYGGVLVDDSGIVTGFARAGTAGRSWLFVGVQVAERAAYADVPDGRPCASIRDVYPALMATAPGAVRAWRTDAPFLDVGTPADYLSACLALSGGAAQVDPSSRIAPSATVDRSVIWEHAIVGAGACLTESVVTDGVVVPAGARYDRRVFVRRGVAGPRPGDVVEGDLHIAPLDRVQE